MAVFRILGFRKEKILDACENSTEDKLPKVFLIYHPSIARQKVGRPQMRWKKRVKINKIFLGRCKEGRVK